MIAELAVLTLFALPLGMWIGGKLAGLTIHAASTETTRLPLILSHQNYLTAIAVVLLSTTISFLIVRREVGKLDLLAVLRTRIAKAPREFELTRLAQDSLSPWASWRRSSWRAWF
jgi:putative ABC transport system permease protein